MAIINKGDRKYLVIIHLGYDNGKRKTKSKRVNLSHLPLPKAEKEIILIEKAFEDEVKGNPDNDAGMTFREFVVMWRENYALPQLRPKTIASYDYELEHRILPEFGYMKITQIRPTHLIKFYNKLTKDGIRRDGKSGGLSGRTIKYQHQIISSIMGQASNWQVIKDNPCKYVSPPKVAQKKEKNYLEVDEAATLLEAIREERLKYICATELALFGGLRTEEILGLDINDITDDGITIRRTSKYVRGKGMVVEDLAKNDTSLRSITLAAPVIIGLKKLRAEQKAAKFMLQNKWADGDRTLLFTQDNGAPMHGDTLNHWLKKFISKYKQSNDGITEITFHGLRHTSASLMIYLGADIKVGATRLGHAQTSTFLNFYGHMMEKADKAIADKLGDVLLKKSN